MSAVIAKRVAAVALAAAAALTFPGAARAGLFDDDEARKAILDLRQRTEQLAEQQRQMKADQATGKQVEALQQQVDTLKRSLLDLNNQLEALRADLAKLRGQDEQLARDVADVQRQQKDAAQALNDRLHKLEPQTVSVDGRDFQVDPDEKRAYEDALASFRKGDFAAADNGFTAFLRRYPKSGYVETVSFWLGNAQYGERNYKDAIVTFRALVKASPDHVRAPEALLSAANCQIELKETKGARKTLDELIKAYPKSEAAQAARERLASLK